MTRRQTEYLRKFERPGPARIQRRPTQQQLAEHKYAQRPLGLVKLSKAEVSEIRQRVLCGLQWGVRGL
jgi:hypothetical protein